MAHPQLAVHAPDVNPHTTPLALVNTCVRVRRHLPGRRTADKHGIAFRYLARPLPVLADERHRTVLANPRMPFVPERECRHGGPYRVGHDDKQTACAMGLQLLQVNKELFRFESPRKRTIVASPVPALLDADRNAESMRRRHHTERRRETRHARRRRPEVHHRASVRRVQVYTKHAGNLTATGATGRQMRQPRAWARRRCSRVALDVRRRCTGGLLSGLRRKLRAAPLGVGLSCPSLRAVTPNVPARPDPIATISLRVGGVPPRLV